MPRKKESLGKHFDLMRGNYHNYRADFKFQSQIGFNREQGLCQLACEEVKSQNLIQKSVNSPFTKATLSRNSSYVGLPTKK